MCSWSACVANAVVQLTWACTTSSSPPPFPLTVDMSAGQHCCSSPFPSSSGARGANSIRYTLFILYLPQVPEATLSVLRTLCADPNNHVCVLSGLGRDQVCLIITSLALVGVVIKSDGETIRATRQRLELWRSVHRPPSVVLSLNSIV